MWKSARIRRLTALRSAKRESNAARKLIISCRSGIPARLKKTRSFVRKPDLQAVRLSAKRVILAGQVGIAGHLRVGDDAVLTAKSATSARCRTGENHLRHSRFRQPRLAALDCRIPSSGRNGKGDSQSGKTHRGFGKINKLR